MLASRQNFGGTPPPNDETFTQEPRRDVFVPLVVGGLGFAVCFAGGLWQGANLAETASWLTLGAGLAAGWGLSAFRKTPTVDPVAEPFQSSFENAASQSGLGWAAQASATNSCLKTNSTISTNSNFNSIKNSSLNSHVNLSGGANGNHDSNISSPSGLCWNSSVLTKKLDSLLDWFGVHHVDNHEITVSEGRLASSLQGSWRQWMFAEDQSSWVALENRIENSRFGEVVECEHRYRLPDNSECWLRSRHIACNRAEQGKLLSHMAIAMDITKEKNETESRERDHKKTRSSLCAFPGAVFLARLSPEGSLEIQSVLSSRSPLLAPFIKEASQNPRLLSQVTPTTMTNKAWSSSLQDAAIRKIDWNGEFSWRSPDKNEIPLRLWLGPLVSTKDDQLEELWCGFLLDNVDNWQLHSRLNRLAEAWLGSPDFLLTFNQAQTSQPPVLPPASSVWISKGIRHFIGLKPQDSIPSNFFAQLFPERAIRLILEEGMTTAKDDKPWLEETAILKPDGTEIPVSLLLTVSRDRDDSINWTLSMRDISYLKRREKDLRVSLDRFETLNKTKDHFLSSISRTLRTPLFSTLGGLDVLRQAPDPEARIAALGFIERSGQRLREIVDDLFDLARLREGDLRLNYQVISPWKLARDVVAATRSQTLERDLTLTVVAKTPLPRRLEVDPDRFRQALVALLDHAFEQTKVKVEIWMGLEQDRKPQSSDGLNLRIDIKAEGDQSPTDSKQTSFRAFNLDDVEIAKRSAGLELRLAVAHGLIETMGGVLAIPDNLDARHWIVLLPIPEATAHDLENPEPIFSWNLPRISTCGLMDAFADGIAPKRVLVVEDNDDHRSIISYYLMSAGYDVTTARDGQEGTELALNHPYDVILMDIEIPIIDGCEATKLLRTNGITTPILAVTANAFPEERRRCLNAGCADYLIKPVKQDTLLSTLAGILGNDSSPLATFSGSGSGSSPASTPTLTQLNESDGEDNDEYHHQEKDSITSSVSTEAILNSVFARDIKPGATSLFGPSALASNNQIHQIGDANLEHSVDSTDLDLVDDMWLDPEFQEMVQEFVQALPSRLADVENALAQKDFEQIEAITHQLKGAGGMFGHPELSEISSQIVIAARSQPDLATLQSLVNQLRQCVIAAQTG